MKQVVEQLLFRGMWQNSLDSMFLIRYEQGEFFIDGINPVLEELVHTTSESLHGTPVREFLPDPETVLEQYATCIRLQETLYYEEESVAPDGQSNFWHTMLVPLHDRDVQYVFGSSRDITDLKRAEHRIQKARDQAEAASASKTLFLANMSHELRTPLNGIIGTASLLREEQPDATMSGDLDLIIRSGDAMNRLVDDILDLSKIEHNSLNIDPAPCDLRPTIADICRVQGQAAQAKGLDFRHHIDQELPDRLMLDEARVRQILLNLTTNAVKFTDRGTITLSVLLASDELILHVEDTGMGMPPALVKRVGTPFYQINPGRTRHSDGSGIGLSVCKSLIDLMGGRLEIESEPGNGTRVSVTLPVHTADEQPASAAGPQYSLPDNCQVLIVEDNQTNQIILQRMLQHLGAEVALAKNGEEALTRADETAFDLVLMDLHMPGMGGIAATHALREQGLEAPIVAVTASVTQHERDACRRARMDGFVDKPVKVATLARLLAELFP